MTYKYSWGLSYLHTEFSVGAYTSCSLIMYNTQWRACSKDAPGSSLHEVSLILVLVTVVMDDLNITRALHLTGGSV